MQQLKQPIQMIITTINQFIAYVPTASGTEFTAIEPFLKQAENELISLLLGKDLYQYLETAEEGNSILDKTSQLLCFKAYKNAIPFVDLIQTPNGFGVVSNANVAPASKERVERLLSQVDKMVDRLTDLLIAELMITDEALTEWAKLKKFNNLTNCLFCTGIELANYCAEAENRADFLKLKSKLLTAQKDDLSEAISIDYVAELIDQQRTNTVTETNEFVIENCKLILGKYAEKEGEHEAEEMLNQLINFIEKSVDNYPTYKASAEYAIRHTAVYANKQTDPTFFFGI